MLIEGLVCFSYASDMNLCSGCNTVFRGVVLICVLQNMALATPAHLSPACLSLAAQSFPKCLSFICSLSPTYLPLVTPCPLLVSPLVSRLSPPTCLPLVFCFPPLFSACFPLASHFSRLFVADLSPPYLPLGKSAEFVWAKLAQKIIAHVPGARIRCGLTLDCTGKAIYAQPMAANLLRFFREL